MKVKEFISTHRQKANLTQEKLAELLNVTNTTISNYENGVSLPNIHTLIYLAELFNAPLTELMDGHTTSKSEIFDQLINKYEGLIPKNARLTKLIEEVNQGFSPNNSCMIVTPLSDFPTDESIVVTSCMHGKPHMYRIVKFPEFHVFYPLSKDKKLTPIAFKQVPDDLMLVISIINFI